VNDSAQQPNVPPNRFAELASINVSKYVEKKGNLSYLSWAWAVDQLLRLDPDACWAYGEPTRFGETMMVVCTVTAFGKPRTMQLPVMDHRNKAIANPDAFAVNTALQRCLVKAIALHGLGLYIYAGEDVPRGETNGDASSHDEAPPELDQDTVLAFEQAATHADVAFVWNGLSKEERPKYRDVKTAALKRTEGREVKEAALLRRVEKPSLAEQG